MSSNFKFNDVIECDMKRIYNKLKKEYAIKLLFDNKKIATSKWTHLISVNKKNINYDYKFDVSNDNNIYFLFDKNFNCQYVGKKGNEAGINYRLGLHLIKNKTQTSSCIQEVCNYLNKINDEERIIYVITLKIEPSYMVEGVESYFIDYFRKNKNAKWVKRK